MRKYFKCTIHGRTKEHLAERLGKMANRELCGGAYFENGSWCQKVRIDRKMISDIHCRSVNDMDMEFDYSKRPDELQEYFEMREEGQYNE